MDFICHFFWNHLLWVDTEVRFIDGKEQTCLIIPTQINQIKKGRQGNWLSTFRMIAEPPNEKMITHTIQLGYLNWDEVNKAKMAGCYHRTQHLGRVRVHDRTPSKKVDRTNSTNDIICRGNLILSDIPKSLLFRNDQNDKRYVQNVIFRNLSNDAYVYIGSICVDDIPKDDIKTEPYTGKKYVDTIFCKLKTLDTYMNTHQLIIAKEDGSEIEIGKFKEFKKDGQVETTHQEEHTTTISQRPEIIDGIRF